MPSNSGSTARMPQDTPGRSSNLGTPGSDTGVTAGVFLLVCVGRWCDLLLVLTLCSIT